MLSQQVALDLMRVALRAADPATAIKQGVRVSDGSLFVRNERVLSLKAFERTFVFGAGKAACEMASACCAIGLNISGGLVITKLKHAKPDDAAICRATGIDVEEASHPLPCEKGESATRELLTRLQSISDPKTLIIWLASGGGSALTGGLGVNPSLSLPVLKECMQALLDSGADIEQVNAVRKHLCAAHGGRVGLAAGKSTVLTLCVSDIIGSPLNAIAGGPTTADITTLSDCRNILSRLYKNKRIPSALEKAFFSGSADELVPETPKVLPPNILSGIILVDLQSAIDAAMKSCKERYPGAKALVLSSRLSGEAAELGRTLATLAADITVSRPFVLFAGGETTVTMDSSKAGKGGRNQELALAAAVHMMTDDRCPETVCVLSVGTDGTDGPTDAAGAVVTKETIKAENLERATQSLSIHDSYNFFTKYAPQAHLKIGPTGTNVMDLMILCDFGPNSKQ